MLVYDITQEKTFDNISKWLRNIEEVMTEINLTCVGLKAVSKFHLTVVPCLEVNFYPNIELGEGEILPTFETKVVVL